MASSTATEGLTLTQQAMMEEMQQSLIVTLMTDDLTTQQAQVVLVMLGRWLAEIAVVEVDDTVTG